ncbi:Hypothetical protein NTJ_02576 [Nesidiocoris tenuis]|uniref:Secreted protein n=1 Tax=Nesidiocoris tenuis TaxID=355587 RepID=A0ABN7ABT0_9HEMI|nr:Hypothetical protein NTJ_02576 [Nesidiocoris tenuis]
MVSLPNLKCTWPPLSSRASASLLLRANEMTAQVPLFVREVTLHHSTLRLWFWLVSKVHDEACCVVRAVGEETYRIPRPRKFLLL